MGARCLPALPDALPVCPLRAVSVNDSSCAPAHNTPFPLERSPPASFKRLLGGAACITLSDMKTSALTIRLDPDLSRQLARQAKRTGRSRSDVAREALRRQLAVAQFEDLRRRLMPLAEARGYLTDEDVLRDVSGRASWIPMQ